MAMDDRDVAFFFFCGHSDTGLDLVNTADFSLVSIQPYELAYHAYPFHRRINNLYHILLLYTYRRTPYQILSILGAVKVLIGKDDIRDYRGARIKRITVTAIEYISANSRYLIPIIIWPATTYRSNWTIFPTPG